MRTLVGNEKGEGRTFFLAWLMGLTEDSSSTDTNATEMIEEWALFRLLVLVSDLLVLPLTRLDTFEVPVTFS